MLEDSNKNDSLWKWISNISPEEHLNCTIWQTEYARLVTLRVAFKNRVSLEVCTCHALPPPLEYTVQSVEFPHDQSHSTAWKYYQTDH